MSTTHDGPSIRAFKRNLDSVQDHYTQAAGLLLSSTNPGGSGAEAGASAITAAPASWQLQHRTLEIQLQQLQPAYLQPAQLLNAYLEWAAVDQLWDRRTEDNQPPRRPDLLRRATADAYINGMLLSMKAGLDLLVPILAGYFRGLPRHASWGEYRPHDQATGWMAVVAHGMDRDPLLYRIDQAYRSWIVVALAPGRGHMEDRSDHLYWEYTDSERLLVTGRWATPEGCPAYRYAAGLLACLLNEWYRTVNDVLMTLTVRPQLPPVVAWEVPPPSL